jgi:hypothetical protein
VYSKAGERFDPQKKGGRFKPEFIWQTNWQEQLKRQEDLERQQAEYRRRQQQGGITGGTGPGEVAQGLRLGQASGQHNHGQAGRQGCIALLPGVAMSQEFSCLKRLRQ